MAQIPIERQGRSVWPWVLVVLVILTIVWVVLSPTGRTMRGDAGEIAAADAAQDGAPRIPTSGLPDDVAAFVSFARGDSAGASADSTHAYTAEGVRALATALGSLSPRDSSGAAVSQPQLDSMRAIANAMQRDPASRDHARQARLAFDIAGTVMQQVQLRVSPAADAEVQDARISAWGVSDSRPLLSQREAVERFFDRAAAAVQALARAGA